MDQFKKLFQEGYDKFLKMYGGFFSNLWDLFQKFYNWISSQLEAAWPYIMLVIAVLVTLAVVWLLTALVERIQKRLVSRGWLGIVVYALFLLGIYIPIVIGLEVAFMYVFGVDILTAFVIVLIVNAIAIWWHSFHQEVVPVWLTRRFARRG